MVFVHTDPEERMVALTLATVSRYMVLRDGGKPAVIPNGQMARFRSILDYSGETVCISYSPLVRGKKARVAKGFLMGLVGGLVALDGESKVVIRLDMSGCTCVGIPIGYVEQTDERN